MSAVAPLRCQEGAENSELQMDADVSSTSVSLISADGGFDAELSTKHRPVSMMASDSHLKEVPAARIQALVRRLAQQPDPVSRPTSISTSVTMAAPHTPLETSRDVPESPNEAPHVLPDPHASDADDVCCFSAFLSSCVTFNGAQIRLLSHFSA